MIYFYNCMIVVVGLYFLLKCFVDYVWKVWKTSTLSTHNPRSIYRGNVLMICLFVCYTA